MPTDQPVYNKDEAERVRDIGIATLHKGDAAKAIWWFNKSKKLYHLDGIEEWLVKAAKQQQTGPTSTHQAPPPQPVKEVPVEAAAVYSEEQLAIVNKIIGFVDFYDKLSIAYTVVDAEEIKKQYRQVCTPPHATRTPHAAQPQHTQSTSLAYMSPVTTHHVQPFII